MRFISTLGIAVMLMLFSVSYGQLPGEKTRGASQYQGQEAHDAVQDNRLATLERITSAVVETNQEMRDKLNYIWGGLLGFGAVLTYLQVLQLRKMK